MNYVQIRVICEHLYLQFCDQPLMLSCLFIVRVMHDVHALSNYHLQQKDAINIYINTSTLESDEKIVDPLRSHVTSSSSHPREA